MTGIVKLKRELLNWRPCELFAIIDASAANLSVQPSSKRSAMRKFSSYGPVDKELHFYVPREKLIRDAC
jgi:hypothetical protein